MPFLALAIFLVTGAVNLQLPLYASDARDAGPWSWPASWPRSGRPSWVSGYFVAAYLGFGLPAVALGAMIDVAGATAGFAALTGVVTLASAGIGASALSRRA